MRWIQLFTEQAGVTQRWLKNSSCPPQDRCITPDTSRVSVHLWSTRRQRLLLQPLDQQTHEQHCCPCYTAKATHLNNCLRQSQHNFLLFISNQMTNVAVQFFYLVMWCIFPLTWKEGVMSFFFLWMTSNLLPQKSWNFYCAFLHQLWRLYLQKKKSMVFFHKL